MFLIFFILVYYKMSGQSYNIAVFNSYYSYPSNSFTRVGVTYTLDNSANGLYTYFSSTGNPQLNIPNSAFYTNGSSMPSLVSFSCGNQVTSIGTNAFQLTNLTNISLPNSLINISNDSIRETLLSTVTFPPNLTNIGGFAFTRNAFLKQAIFTSPNIPTIGTQCFQYAGGNPGSCVAYVPYQTTDQSLTNFSGTEILSTVRVYPSAPTNITAIDKQYGSVTLSWIPPQTYGIYTVDTYTITSTPSFYTNIVSNSVTSVNIGGLSKNQTYTFTVTANFLNNEGSYSATSNSVTANYPCFLVGSKILTDKGYIAIEELRKGNLVKTLLNGYLPIVLIGKRPIYNSGDDARIKQRLYNLSTEKYPTLTEDLVLTGCHSLLVDILTKEQEEATLANYGEFKITDDKVRLETYLDPNADPYPEKGTFTIYHLALENKIYTENYGIWANGLLVETCSIRYLKELSNMELVE